MQRTTLGETNVLRARGDIMFLFDGGSIVDERRRDDVTVYSEMVQIIRYAKDEVAKIASRCAKNGAPMASSVN
ncbi:MAG: hypothetical protein MHM6MM_006299 [Cercozoa sp. M6MM]